MQPYEKLWRLNAHMKRKHGQTLPPLDRSKRASRSRSAGRRSANEAPLSNSVPSNRFERPGLAVSLNDILQPINLEIPKSANVPWRKPRAEKTAIEVKEKSEVR